MTRITVDAYLNIPSEIMTPEILDTLYVNKYNVRENRLDKVKFYKKVNHVYKVHRNAIPDYKTLFGVPVDREFTDTPIETTPIKAELRDYQEDAVEEALRQYENNMNTDVFLKAPCGSGKTVMAIAILCRLGVKTFITVPNAKLRDQWIDEIERFTDVKVAKYLNSTHKKSIKADVCVSTVQAVMKSKHKFDEFSLLIIDEAHGSSADVWSQHILSFSGRRLVITATPDRADGLDVVLKAHCGEVSIEIPQEMLRERGYVLDPYVLFVKNPKSYHTVFPWNQRLDHNTMYNKMATDEERNVFIKELVERYIEKGHNALFVSKRVAHSEWFSENLDDCSIMIGKSKQKMLRHVAGSEGIVKEGLDKSDLSLAVILTPVGNKPMFEQIIGRVARINPTKPQRPIVIVIVDTYNELLDIVRGRIYSDKTYTEVAMAKNYRFCKELNVQCFVDTGEKILKI